MESEINIFSYSCKLASIYNFMTSLEQAQTDRQKILNFSLLYPELWVEKEIKSRLDKRVETLGKDELKRVILERLVSLSKTGNENAMSSCKEHLSAIFEAYETLGRRVAYFEAKLLSRGLFGASQTFGESIFELALEFDPFFNVPVIPGSSIKGALRSVWKYPKGGDEVEELFGTTEHSGLLIFSDAYPVKPGRGGFLLYPDIINPHYYKDGEDVLDESKVETTPIVYLTVAPETTYGFVFASDSESSVSAEDFRELTRVLFKNFGLGGKTSVGYGRFEITSFKVKGWQ